MANRYLEKLAMNRVTRYAFEKTRPYLETVLEPARGKGVNLKRSFDAFKGQAKKTARSDLEKRAPTGKLI